MATAALDWSQCPPVESVPGRVSGAWVLRDTRVPILIVLGRSPWPLVRLHIPEIVAAVNAAAPGSFAEVDIPLPPKEPFQSS